MKYFQENAEDTQSQVLAVLRTASAAILLCLAPMLLAVQAADTERPVPILKGNAGFFSNVNAGQTQLVPEITPVVLIPAGNRILRGRDVRTRL